VNPVVPVVDSPCPGVDGLTLAFSSSLCVRKFLDKYCQLWVGQHRLDLVEKARSTVLGLLAVLDL